MAAVAGEEEDGWYQGEDGEWYHEEDDYDEDWGEDDYDEDDDYSDDFGALIDMPVKRVVQHGINRQKNCGIHTIEIYQPQFYFKQIEMEEYDAQPDRFGPSVIGKYTKGVGMIEARFPTDDEDPISFALTVTHRLLDRMEREGFNETGRYRDDGEEGNLPIWNSIGRLDIGSESLVDRSKSMKSYVMDLFERYGDGEANIEGVDMYNACYGGQAAGLCAVNWVECDRWDGRYGLSIATDISDAGEGGFWGVGASCTGALYFPDAPLTHTSLRASCIMHRFDFFKPVGWHGMQPVVDGKYSINAYMSAVETCYHILRKKMGGKPLLEIADYNAFHTGGGYHVVKRAFKSFINSDNPRTPQEQRDRMLEEKLNPSCHLLKLIGPCHTVSSFLNTSSVIMSQWDKALGKILMVYTYGSGCASSLYQMRFNDIPWFQPLEVWKMTFYRNAIYQPPSTQIHFPYVDTWMKFDYEPWGRNYYGIPVEKYELDAYYLLEIDAWGRRFFHRGGLRAKPLAESEHIRWDEVENRTMREKFGAPQIAPPREEKLELTQEERWKQIEFEMTYDPEADQDGGEQVVDEHLDRLNASVKVISKVVKEKSKSGLSIEKDGEEHTYQIIGTWTRMEEAQDMIKNSDGSFSFEVTLGANGWEQFHLIQDKNWSRLIYPAYAKSGTNCPCIGPHKGPPNQWMLDGRDVEGVPADLVGSPGTQYTVTFSWTTVKMLQWQKTGSCALADESKYYVCATWTCWDIVEIPKHPSIEGCFMTEVQMSHVGLQFQLMRNKDKKQLIYPDVEDEDTGCSGDRVLGCDDGGEGKLWAIDGQEGDVFQILFRRPPESLDDMRLDWNFVANKPLVWTDRFFVYFPGVPQDQQGPELVKTADGDYVGEFTLGDLPQDFQIIRNRQSKSILHPDKAKCTQMMAHNMKGPSATPPAELCWSIGKAVSDRAKKGDIFVVNLDSDLSRVSWKKQGP